MPAKIPYVPTMTYVYLHPTLAIMSVDSYAKAIPKYTAPQNSEFAVVLLS
jgi:hypothetical protein